jgi:hypothetical protein
MNVTSDLHRSGCSLYRIHGLLMAFLRFSHLRVSLLMHTVVKSDKWVNRCPRPSPGFKPGVSHSKTGLNYGFCSQYSNTH